ncbi:fibroblast growth factor binding protein 2a [Hemibagrus wyckioides]|uniref:fibroblast growth factor binding protein 2a n=1 Tax=Hemibagrus wyckioides TaxID=337641 RepID=UPI00266C9BE0|nr:fibroblast growth factor binding protein 2a [Hemibagrus wyckioides]XP_058252514.1 fibroblast growth factor binding protein 2a [Hemibagrus wyckioides]
MQILSCVLVLSCCVWAAVANNQDGQNAAEAGRSKITWEEPIQFVTKTKDRCSMTLTGHGELTRLRVSCVGQEASYWCEYEGKPDVCRNYNTNPRHFFTQIMWELRKLNSACQGPRILKPTMCKKASDESQMVITASSSSTVVQAPLKPQTTQTTATKQEQPKPEQAKPEPSMSAPRSDQAKPEQKPNAAKQKPSRQKPAKPQPTRPPPARPTKAKTELVKAEAVKPVASKPGTKTTTTLKKILAPKAATQAPTTTTPAPTRSAESLAQQYCWHGMQDFCTKVIGWFTK